jgi:hypothetical protein
LGGGIRAWVAVVKAGDVGKDNEEICFDEGGDQGREVVIVTEADFIITTVSFSLMIGIMRWSRRVIRVLRELR